MAKEKSTQITFEDVEKAAKYLEAEGRKITNANIYNEVGRGSMTTINKFLQEYLTQSVEKISAQISQDFFQAFSKEVIRVADQKEIVLTNALSALHEYIDSLEISEANLHKKLDEKEMKIVSQNIEVAKSKKIIAELTKKIELTENFYVSKMDVTERMLEASHIEIGTLKKAATNQYEVYNELLVKCTRFESLCTSLQEERNRFHNDLNDLREKGNFLQELYRSSLLTIKGQEIKIETMAEQNNVLRARIANLEEELTKCSYNEKSVKK